MHELIVVPFACPHTGELDMVLTDPTGKLPVSQRSWSHVAEGRARGALCVLGFGPRAQYLILAPRPLARVGGLKPMVASLIVITGALRAPISPEQRRQQHRVYRTLESTEEHYELELGALRTIIEESCGLPVTRSADQCASGHTARLRLDGILHPPSAEEIAPSRRAPRGILNRLGLSLSSRTSRSYN